jgi:signal transduction histidine kinase
LVTSDTERQHLAEELARGPERRLAEIAELVAQLAPGDREGPTVRALEHVHQAREDLAALSAGLYPGELSELGLAGALTQVAARGPLSVEARISVPPLSDELEAAAYFVACEALTNVVKHAAVDRAQLRAEVQEGLLVIEVTDDGRGGADAAGAGLTGLADRVMTLGGTLRIDTVTSGGTRVTAALPLAPAQEEDSG